MAICGANCLTLSAPGRSRTWSAGWEQVPAWPDVSAELAIGARRTDGRFGDAARGLAAGNLVKVLAFRGATHLMTSGTRVRTWRCEPRAGGGQKMCHSAACWHRVPVVAYGVNRRDVVGRE